MISKLFYEKYTTWRINIAILYHKLLCLVGLHQPYYIWSEDDQIAYIDCYYCKKKMGFWIKAHPDSMLYKIKKNLTIEKETKMVNKSDINKMDEKVLVLSSDHICQAGAKIKDLSTKLDKDQNRERIAILCDSVKRMTKSIKEIIKVRKSK